MARGPKPIMMTLEQANSWFGTPMEKLEKLAEGLDQVGFYLRKNNPLYPTEQLEERIKNG